MVKLVAFLLILASCFQSLNARDLEIEVSDGLNVLQLLDVSQSFCPGNLVFTLSSPVLDIRIGIRLNLD